MLDNCAISKDQDSLGLFGNRETMGNEYDGPVGKGEWVISDFCFCKRVKVTG